jgi:predicted glycosyltransferase
VFDGGSGIGHLRRLARIAAAMQDRFSCLIMTGHDAAPQWLVPQGCEYLRLPSWDSLIRSKAAYWGRPPFLDLSLPEAARFRSTILEGAVRAFQPDVLFVDHLPLGAEAELGHILKHTRCRKYLVTRGLQNETEDLERLVLGGAALDSLRTDYDRIFSAIDPRVFDLSAQYGLPSEVVAKIDSVGYVAPSAGIDRRAVTRAAHGVADDELWVVASAGGGQWGEPLVEACLDLAALHQEARFDIVIGPRSRLPVPAVSPEYRAGGRIRVHASCQSLADLHAAADVVITTGGYNTLLECIRGQARILCIPYRRDHRDEPFRHATLLGAHVDLKVENDLSHLPAMLENAIRECRAGPPIDRRAGLQMSGADRIAEIVLDDVGASPLNRALL